MPTRGDPGRSGSAARQEAGPGAPAALPEAAGRNFRLLLLCLGLAALLTLLLAADLFADRRDLWHRATDSARQLSLLLGQEVEHAVTGLDRALRLAAARQAAPGTGALPPALRRALLFDQAMALEDVRLVLLLDAEGAIRLASREPAGLPPGGTAAGYLPPPCSRPWEGLWISPPLPGPGGREVVALGRALSGADGRFAGAVVGLLDLGALRQRLEAALQAAGGDYALGLHRRDGIRLLGAGQAGPPEPEAGIAGLFREAAGQPQGAFVAPAPEGGLRAHARAGDWPLLLSVTRSAADIEAAWRPHAIAMGLTTAGLFLILLPPILLLQREVVRRRAAEQEARRSSDEFRLLMEHGGDLVSRIGPDRIRRYVSPACRRILGYEPEELTGRAPRDLTHPDDRQQMLDTVGPVYAGEQETATAAYRLRRRDGSWVWLEATIRTVRDPVTGALDGIVAIARDVTERKRLEVELARIVTEDSLTGLANRRAFDAGLTRELGRCAALGQPLAVLLIDVDHFKLYNDHCGHPRGDACLRRVAAAIGAAAARPGELAARYGGEEFILLLPGLSLEKAEPRAEALRAAVEALAVPHPGIGGRVGVVTISIGLASIVPEPGREEEAGEKLILRADHCLYEAKRRGRNCVIAFGSPGVVA
ncbi:diguanylate cyclase [Siccirubricoccus sp. KC 17139]|uniref:diguanylate cyclase n=1 Tax=Siccirubricoccus soli TaxID=2899147 RepID=A0ABT1D9Y9_9PROT|nr:diguanylate cyclase [Siccirubricoccus soli]MCO6418728.1 diguanylate cyclase [Siccirubricoccus soli]MCP2684863.1 diguanylate cyclase [Siccirubricoccus soli]